MTIETPVLLVEDNPAEVDLTLIACKQINFPYKVVVTRDGIEALDYLMGTGKYAGRDKKNTPVLVLLDLKMPRLNGFEVLERMRRDPLLKDIFVVILTSSMEEKERMRAMNLGADLYLQKAVDFDEFSAALRQLERQILLRSADNLN